MTLPRLKLRTSILIGLLFICVVPLAVSVALYLPTTLSALERSAYALASADARTDATILARRLDFLKTSLLRLSELANSWNLAMLPANKRQQTGMHLAEAAGHWVSGHTEVVALVLAGKDGRELLRVSPNLIDAKGAFAVAAPETDKDWYFGETFAAQTVDVAIAKWSTNTSSSRLVIGAPVLGRTGDKAATLIMEVNVPVLASDAVDVYWVGWDGGFLLTPATSAITGPRAFERFPGIVTQFEQARPFTYESDEQSVSWIPVELGETKASKTWIGAPVDARGIRSWLGWYQTSIIPIMVLAVVLSVFMAWLLSRRMVRFGRAVVDGFERMIDRGERVSFDTRGGDEFPVIARKMNKLAERYLEDRATQKLAQSHLQEAKTDLESRVSKLTAKQGRLQATLRSIPNPVLLVNGEGRGGWCNEAALALLGYKDEVECLGKTIDGYLVAENQQIQPRDTVAKTLNMATAGHGEQAAALQADGSSVAVEWWSQPVMVNGQAISAIVTLRDLTASLAVEQAKAQQRQEIQMSLDAIAEGVVTADAAGEVRYLNPAGATLLGWNAADAQGQPLTSLLPLQAVPGERPANDETSPVEILKAASGEILASDRDGQSLYLEHKLSPINAPDGKLVGSVVVFRDVTGAPRMSHKPDYQKTHDVLTGLIGAEEFTNRIERAITNTMDQHSKHVLCYLDLDQFRKFNDGGGQAAGDAFLRQIASLLRAKVRSRDSVARLGGDDFGILLEHCPMDKAMRIASKLRQSIQEFQMRWDGDTYHLTASVGVTPISTMGQSASSLLSAAEATCYIAKTVGGNRVKVHRPEDQELQQYSQTRWVERINQALEENGFRLFYQPIVPVPGRAVGDRTPHYELLLRMVDETGKLRSAGSFLPFAERYNMIQVTDRWVVRTAFEWLATGGYSAKDLIIALNVSEPTVSDPDFAEYVKQQLNQTEISADCICFQIAARTAHARPNVAASFIQGLIGMGFRTAIDNLGTGLWSADQLAGLQVDYLKIESTHIEDITTSSLNQAIVKSVTEIARVLGMKTIAKAVENDATLEALQRIGVDYAQGYGVARPKPLDFLKKTR